MTRLTLCVLSAILLNPCLAEAGRQLKGKATPRTALPQDHPYQKAIRGYMAKLTEKDFTHGVTAEISMPAAAKDLEYHYRNHLLTLMPQPLVGTKRGIPAVNAPARLFLLSAIESLEGVKVPPVWPETLMTFVQWNYPGNPYHENRALKLRAFVSASVMLMMLDDQLDSNPERGGSRADWLSYQLVVFASPYPGFKDQLPREVQQGYETLLRKMGRRVLDWGPKGEEPNFDVITTLGVWYIAKALNDPAFMKEAEAYSRRLFTDPKHFHPAGYFLDNRGIDVGYQGITNFFTSGVALASGWPFAKDAVTKSYRLRAHLCLPEPDGSFVGPSHFNTRTSSDAWGDQWAWGGARDQIASLVTDEAAYLAQMPSQADLLGASARRAQGFRGQLHENPVNGKGGFLKNEEINSNVWTWRIWHSFNFPASVNFGYEFYPAGSHARRMKLEKENSPWLKSPFQRDESFLRDFEKAFTVGKYPTYAGIVHSGPVGVPDRDDGLFKFAGPLGFGGGQLSAFWTPATGAVILGRRGGNSWQKAFDVVDEWRTWPIHAVSGSKPDGKVFTTGRIVQPEVSSAIADNKGTVEVSGVIPAEMLGQGKVLEGKVRYTRTFDFGANQLSIETRIQAHGQDKVAELYETIPVFIQDGKQQKKEAETGIEFEVDGKWKLATAEFQERVTAVKLTRFTGAVQITFAGPQRVKLSPTVWKDTYLSRAVCRNLMIDLLGGTATPAVLKGKRSVKYQIRAAKK